MWYDTKPCYGHSHSQKKTASMSSWLYYRKNQTKHITTYSLDVRASESIQAKRKLSRRSAVPASDLREGVLQNTCANKLKTHHFSFPDNKSYAMLCYGYIVMVLFLPSVEDSLVEAYYLFNIYYW